MPARAGRRMREDVMIKMSIGKAAGFAWLAVPVLSAFVFASVLATPAHEQYACTTNYCIRSQSRSVTTHPGWPTPPKEPCCQTHWGALPGGIDWTNGSPVM